MSRPARPAGDTSEQLIARRLHEPLPFHDPATLRLVDRRLRVRLEHRALRLLELQDERLLAAISSGRPTRGSPRCPPHLRAMWTNRIARPRIAGVGELSRGTDEGTSGSPPRTGHADPDPAAPRRGRAAAVRSRTGSPRRRSRGAVRRPGQRLRAAPSEPLRLHFGGLGVGEGGELRLQFLGGGGAYQTSRSRRSANSCIASR